MQTVQIILDSHYSQFSMASKHKAHYYDESLLWVSEYYINFYLRDTNIKKGAICYTISLIKRKKIVRLALKVLKIRENEQLCMFLSSNITNNLVQNLNILCKFDFLFNL